jgi:hypothetical protein
MAGTCNISTGVCTNPVGNNGAVCNDNNACTSGTTCLSGSCQGGTTTTCTASDACHLAGTCNTSTGACSNPYAALGTPCGSSVDDACTRPDTCNASGACLMNNKLNGTACDDGVKCTKPDTCQSGVCQAGQANRCKVTCGGEHEDGDDRASFGFNVEKSEHSTKGQLDFNRYTNPKATYHSSQMNSLEIESISHCTANSSLSGQKAISTGTIRRKGQADPCDFRVEVEDCGESGDNDYFSMEITGPGECHESRHGHVHRGKCHVH